MLVILVLGLAPGFLVNNRWFALSSIQSYCRIQWQRLVQLDTTSLLLWAIIGVVWILVVHGLYNPFLGDDTLSRYGLHAKLIYMAGQIPVDVVGYPPLVPIGYAATWYAAGQVNEHLAQMLPVVTAVGTLGATYLLGREAWNEQIGVLGMAITALTTMFVDNATLGYTDIPTAFPLTLSAFYVLRWWKHGSIQAALLVGLLVGIALLTKQSALTWIGSLVIVAALRVISTRVAAAPIDWKKVITSAGAMFLPPVVIASPWYIRNAILIGWPNIIPVAGLYHILGPQTGWLGLIPAAAWWKDFNPWLVPWYSAGWVTGLYLAVRQSIAAFRGELCEAPTHLIHAALIVPYWLIWWTQFSFEARFLLLILPIMALWAAFALVWVISQFSLHRRMASPIRKVVMSAILAAVFLNGTLDRLGGVYRAITEPFASEEQRIQDVKGDLYNLADYIRRHLGREDKIMVMDGSLQYFLLEYDITVGYPQTLADLRGYDYLVHSSSIFAVYNDRLGWRSSEFYQHVWDPLIFEAVYESGGVHIMRILRTEIPSAEEYEVHESASPQEP